MGGRAAAGGRVAAVAAVAAAAVVVVVVVVAGAGLPAVVGMGTGVWGPTETRSPCLWRS